jgi:hypothetical protein
MLSLHLAVCPNTPLGTGELHEHNA